MSIHALTLMALEPDKPQTSDGLAKAIQTNPVVVRRMLATLQKAGIIASHKGPSGGSKLKHPAKQITLRDIYRATETSELFHLPVNSKAESSNESKSLAEAIQSTLKKSESALEDALEEISLSQLVKKAQKKLPAKE